MSISIRGRPAQRRLHHRLHRLLRGAAAPRRSGAGLLLRAADPAGDGAHRGQRHGCHPPPAPGGSVPGPLAAARRAARGVRLGGCYYDYDYYYYYHYYCYYYCYDCYYH